MRLVAAVDSQPKVLVSTLRYHGEGQEGERVCNA